MYVITPEAIRRELGARRVLYIKGCSNTLLYLKRNEINDYLTFQNKDWRVIVDIKNRCLRRIDGDGVISNENALIIEELRERGMSVLNCTERNLRRVVKDINEYLERNCYGWTVRANYNLCSVEMIV